MNRRPPVSDSSGPGATSNGIFAEFFAGFDWDISLLAFLYYCFAIITFYLPGADVAIVLAIATLALRASALRGHPYLVAIVVIVGWTGVTMVASEYRAVSLLAWWTFAKTAMVGVVSFLVIRNRVHLKIALAFLVGCFALFPMRGAFVNYFGGYTMFGRALWNNTYENPNELAVHGVVFLAASMALFVLVKSKFTRLLILIYACLSLLLILFTQSRGTLLAVGVAGLIGLVGQRIRLRPFLAALVAVGVAAWFAPASVWERLGGLRNVSIEGGMKGVDEARSAEQRFLIAKVAAAVAQRHPVFGVGIGGYPSANKAYAERQGSVFSFAGGARDAHNTYLLLAAELGVPGLVAFLAMVLSASLIPRTRSKKLGREDKQLMRMLRLGLLGFMVAGVFGSFAYTNVLYVLLGIMAAAPAALLADQYRPRGTSRRSGGPRNSLPPLSAASASRTAAT